MWYRALPLAFLILAGCSSDEPPQQGITWNDPYAERGPIAWNDPHKEANEKRAAEIHNYCTYVANAQFFSAYAQIPRQGIPPSEHLDRPVRHGIPSINRSGTAKLGAFMSRNVAYSECVRSFNR